MTRTDYASQNDVHPDYKAPASKPSAEYTPVSVSIGHPVKTYQQSAQFGIYTTFVIPPGVANATLIMPEDPDRLRGLVVTNNSNVVLCNSQSAAQAIGNIASATTLLPLAPAGFLVLKGLSPGPLENQSMIWAVNTDPTLIAYVSVCVERVNP
jgi:hypothetical protein